MLLAADALLSPTFTLKWRAGDSFDFAVLLVSFLIGAGYDAYVVHGIAPRWICLLDQSKTPLPVLLSIEEPTKKQAKETRESSQQQTNNASSAADSKAIRAPSAGSEGKLLASRSTFTSKYLEMQQQQDNNSEHKQQRRQYQLDVLYDDDDDDDPLEGKRDVADHFFIEPSTRRVYSQRESPYLAVESVWSHEDYWVNMQTSQPVYTTLFDLANPTDWEYVFLSASERKNAKGDGGDGSKGGIGLEDDLKSLHSASSSGGGAGSSGATADGDNQRDGDDDEELILDVPPSWVAKPHKENSLLAKRQAAFQRSQREHDQGTDEEFERFCSETMFRIQILEQRLASHEETALQKYAEMDQRLHNDPRLRVLHR